MERTTIILENTRVLENKALGKDSLFDIGYKATLTAKSTKTVFIRNVNLFSF